MQSAVKICSPFFIFNFNLYMQNDQILYSESEVSDVFTLRKYSYYYTSCIITFTETEKYFCSFALLPDRQKSYCNCLCKFIKETQT